MFEISVFSNPVTGLVGEGGYLPPEDFPLVTKYDEDLVRPALLLADKVTLRSHRIDLVSGLIRDHNILRYPVPVLSRSIGISERRDPQELALLRVRESDLLSEREIQEFEAVLKSRGEDGEDWARAMDRAEPIRDALAAFFRSQGDALTSQPLIALRGQGLIEEQPWDPTPRTQPQKLIDLEKGEDTAWEREFLTMVDDVANAPVSVMMDGSVQGYLSRFPNGDSRLDSAATVSGAASLMGMVEGVSQMPLDEIADVRSDLAPYLAPFRSFMLEVAGNADIADVPAAEQQRRLILAWEKEVAPAVAELEAQVRLASFRRNAIDLFASRGEALKTLGVAVGVAVAAGFAGFTTLSAGVALATPMLDAFVSSVRQKQNAKRARAYFVHAMDLRKRKRA